jgi:hypothetical protein
MDPKERRKSTSYFEVRKDGYGPVPQHLFGGGGDDDDDFLPLNIVAATTNGIRDIRICLCIMTIISIIVGFLLILIPNKDNTIPIYLTLSYGDSVKLSSFSPRPLKLFDSVIYSPIAVSMLLSGLFYFIELVYWKRVKNDILHDRNRFRSIEQLVTMPFYYVNIAQIMGCVDILLLSYIVVLSMFVKFVSYASELRSVNKRNLYFFISHLISLAILWMTILLCFIYISIHKSIGNNVNIMIVIEAFLCDLLFCTLIFLWRRGSIDHYVHYEISNILISFLSKLILSMLNLLAYR